VDPKERIEKLGFVPDPKQIAAALDVKPEEVEEMEGRLHKADLSLDATVKEGSEKRHIDQLEAGGTPIEEKIDKAQFKDVLEKKLKEFAKGLDGRELKIFQERLLAEVPLTLQAIGDEYGITRERARQIEERIKKKLKDYFEREGLQVSEHLAS
jgi:RNA polymerase sigma-32 factor